MLSFKACMESLDRDIKTKFEQCHVVESTVSFIPLGCVFDFTSTSFLQSGGLLPRRRNLSSKHLKCHANHFIVKKDNHWWFGSKWWPRWGCGSLAVYSPVLSFPNGTGTACRRFAILSRKSLGWVFWFPWFEMFLPNETFQCANSWAQTIYIYNFLPSLQIQLLIKFLYM